MVHIKSCMNIYFLFTFNHMIISYLVLQYFHTLSNFLSNSSVQIVLPSIVVWFFKHALFVV